MTNQHNPNDWRAAGFPPPVSSVPGAYQPAPSLPEGGGSADVETLNRLATEIAHIGELVSQALHGARLAERLAENGTLAGALTPTGVKITSSQLPTPVTVTNSVAATVPGVVTDLNTLIAALRARNYIG